MYKYNESRLEQEANICNDFAKKLEDFNKLIKQLKVLPIKNLPKVNRNDDDSPNYLYLLDTAVALQRNISSAFDSPSDYDMDRVKVRGDLNLMLSSMVNTLQIVTAPLLAPNANKGYSLSPESKLSMNQNLTTLADVTTELENNRHSSYDKLYIGAAMFLSTVFAITIGVALGNPLLGVIAFVGLTGLVVHCPILKGDQEDYLSRQSKIFKKTCQTFFQPSQGDSPHKKLPAQHKEPDCQYRPGLTAA